MLDIRVQLTTKDSYTIIFILLNISLLIKLQIIFLIRLWRVKKIAVKMHITSSPSPRWCLQIVLCYFCLTKIQTLNLQTCKIEKIEKISKSLLLRILKKTLFCIFAWNKNEQQLKLSLKILSNSFSVDQLWCKVLCKVPDFCCGLTLYK